jgi:uncharacterized protein
MTHTIAEANRIYANGGFLEALAFRIQELPGFFPLHVAIFPRTVGLFLLGAFIWRTGLLRGAPTRHGFLFWIAAGGIICGLGLTVAAAYGALLIEHVSLFVGPLAAILLALGYGAAVIGATGMGGGCLIVSELPPRSPSALRCISGRHCSAPGGFAGIAMVPLSGSGAR